jgi:hypothetical protein
MNIEFNEYTQDDVNILKSFKSNDELCDSIFDDELKMYEKIRKRLLDISDKFIEFIGIEFFVHDIVLTGSLANYKWSKYSDADVHILVDFENSEYNSDLLKELFSAKKTVWNLHHNILIKGFEVEMYVQDVNEEHISSGVYSILKNKWVVEPKKENDRIDKNKILNKADDITKQYLNLFKNSKTKDVSRGVEKLADKIRKFRKSGLAKNGEYSYENLTFKLLRRNGFMEKLFDLRNKVLDKKLSIQ